MLLEGKQVVEAALGGVKVGEHAPCPGAAAFCGVEQHDLLDARQGAKQLAHAHVDAGAGDVARRICGEVIGRLAPVAPKVAELLEKAEEDLLVFYAFPTEHWSKLRSTNPLERVNREIGRRSDVVGIFPNDQALLRLAASLLIEQKDEWLVGRRYLFEYSMALVLGQKTEDGVPVVVRPGLQSAEEVTCVA